MTTPSCSTGRRTDTHATGNKTAHAALTTQWNPQNPRQPGAPYAHAGNRIGSPNLSRYPENPTNSRAPASQRRPELMSNWRRYFTSTACCSGTNRGYSLFKDSAAYMNTQTSQEAASLPRPGGRLCSLRQGQDCNSGRSGCWQGGLAV